MSKKENEVPVMGTSLIDYEQLYERLKLMLNSRDAENYTMAQLILVQVDVEKFIYYIWRLSKHHGDKMVNRRTKAGKIFETQSSVSTIGFKTATGFAAWLQKKNWLTPEIYSKLKKDINFELSNTARSHFHDHYVKLKPQYKHLDLDDELTNSREL